MKRITPMITSLALLHLASSAYASSVYFLNEIGPFGTLDLTTGVYTGFGQNGGVNEIGLGEAGGTLYLQSSGLSGNCIGTVNTATGGVTVVGCGASAQFTAFGSTSAGLFTVGADGNLYSVNPSTGAWTLKGPVGVSLTSWGNGGSGKIASAGNLSVSTDSTSLFMTNGNNLFSVNTSTGAATLIGLTKDIGNVQQNFGGLLFQGGTLFGASTAGQIDTLNTSNGQVVTETNITCGGCSEVSIGLAPTISSSAVPEPGTWGLAFMGTAALIRLRRERKR